MAMVQAKIQYQDILRHHAWLAASVFVLVLAAAFVGTSLQTPVYKVRAEIYVEPKPASLLSEASGNISNADVVWMNNQLSVLGSDRVAKKAVHYIQAKLGKRFPVSQALLEKNVRFIRKDHSSVIALEMSAPGKPGDLQAMLQEYLHAYRDTLETMSFDKANQERDFLAKQQASAQDEQDRVSAQLQDFEAHHQAYNLDVQANQMIQRAARLDEQGQLLNVDIQATQAEMAATEKMLPASPEFINLLSRMERDAKVIALRHRLTLLELENPGADTSIDTNRIAELDRLKSLLYQRLGAFAATFRQKLPNGMESMTIGSPMDFSLAEGIMKKRILLDSLRAKAKAAQVARRELASKLSGIPSEAIEYAALKNQFERIQEKVHALQKRLDDATLSQEAAKSFTRVEVLKNPVLPAAPISPNLPFNLLAATLLGVLLAGWSVIVAVHLDRKFRWPFQLSAMASKPLFLLDKLPPRKAFAALMERGNFIIPDAYKRLILHLDQLSEQDNIRRIGLLPVGVFPERGIPTVSLSLYFTELGNKVSLIDLDFSKASVTGLIGSLKLPISVGIQEGPGLSDYLGGDDTELVDIIYPLGKTVYGSLIPSGDSVTDASVAFNQRSLNALENELSPNYRFVFYSLPAITQSYDAVAVSRILDGVILVAYPGVSSLEHIQQAIRELESVNGKLLGVVIQPV